MFFHCRYAEVKASYVNFVAMLSQSIHLTKEFSNAKLVTLAFIGHA